MSTSSEKPSGSKASDWLAVIPARYASKSIPQKNIRPFLDRPLLAWTIEAAMASGVFDRIVLSTDHAEIAEVGRRCGLDVPFLRPEDLARDDTATAPVIRHALDWCRSATDWTPAFVMILEPTSPARQAFHVREAAALLAQSTADSLASVAEVSHHYVPSKLLNVSPDGMLAGFDGGEVRAMKHRRQELAKAYAFNGLVFACRSGLVLQDPPTIWGERVMAYRTDNLYSVDLDNLDDWVIGECRMRHIIG